MAEYIEREAVQTMLENAQMISDGEYCGYCTEDVCLDEIPTADVVEVRHGEWVQDVYDKMMDIYRCSCCETSWSVIDNDMERFNYCPNCGAKMDGKGE